MSSTSALSTRSRTGCMTCKIRRKKCDETHPQCQRCLKSGFECSGYAYVENSGQGLRIGKQKTLPAPRMTKSRLAAIARLNASDDPSLTQALDAVRLLVGERMPETAASSSIQYTSEVPPTFPENTAGSILPTDGETLTTLFNQPDFLTSSWGPDLALATTFDQDIWSASAFYSTLRADLQPKNYGLAPQASPSSLATTAMKPMTEGQSTLFQALFSLGQLGHPPLPTSASTSSSNSASSASLSPDMEDDDESVSDEETEHVTERIRRMIPLDKNAESNALQFVLESYASWIAWVAFEPLRTIRIVQNFVFRHFQEGIDSRLTLVLLANVVRNLGRKNGSINLGYGPMLSLLQTRVRQRLEAVSRTNVHSPEERRESIKVLDACLETVVVEFFTSTVSEVRELLMAAAPIFRQLCLETPGTTVNLPSLLTQPVVSLRNFAHIDVFFNLLLGTPTAFRYDVTGFVSGRGACESQLEMQEDLGLQWLHGTPDQLLVLFAKMSGMWQDGCILDEEGLAEIEREIRDFKPLNTPSPNAFLPVMRLMVQEAWRLAAYIFLYMALAGDSSSSKRVKSVFKQFVRLLSQIKPSRASDLFLKMPALVVSPAAEREFDRNAIRQRVGTERDWRCSKDRMRVVEDYWARADLEGRPLVWSDIVVSRIRVMGF